MMLLYPGLFEHKPVAGYTNVGHLRHNRVYDARPGQRQCAFPQNFWPPLPRSMLHGHDHAAGARNQIHGAPHSFHHFAGDHPVRKIPLLIYFHCSEDAQVNMASTDHGKRLGAGEVSSARSFSDGFFTGINQIGIFCAFDWIRANT